MKTGALIDVLATGAGPAPGAPAARRLLPAAVLGGLLAAAVAVALVGPVPAAMLGAVGLWIKFGYTGLLAAAAGWWAARLSRPAAPTRAQGGALCAVAAGMALLAALALASRPADSRMAYLLGQSWLFCPGGVFVLSIPALAGVLWALRGLAPTRPRRAGFAAGLLAGAVGALGYSMACTEESIAFVAAWYSLGILLTGLAGAALGPRVLRW
jgi:hypothetical protein